MARSEIISYFNVLKCVLICAKLLTLADTCYKICIPTGHLNRISTVTSSNENEVKVG